MVNYFYKLLSTVLTLILTMSIVSAAQIRASVDRNPIPLGESFRLIIEASGTVDADPDFTELEKTFRILSTGQSSNFSLINGSIKRNKTWTMVLIAENAGAFTIPAINFGKDTSNAVVIKIVDNTSARSTEKNPEIYLEVNVEPKSVYVQQQFIYSIKLFRRIRLGRASISEPVSEKNQAIISKLGDDTDKQVLVDGISYSVLERRYAIFPQKSGELKLAPVIFETQIANRNRRQSFFNMDPFNAQGTTKRLKSKAVSLQIKTIPTEFSKKYPNAAWLPVDDLRINDSWSGDINAFTSGEPMTRTINLVAQNLSAAQLPDIKIETATNMKTYPDVPVVTEHSNGKGLVASKQFKTALLPTGIGNQTLAKIVIPWWNVNTNKIQESILPAATVKVIASDNQTTQDKSKAEELLVTPALNDEAKFNNNSVKEVESTQTDSSQSNLWMIFATVFAILWLATLYLLLSLRAKSRNESVTTDSQVTSKKISTTEIKKSCLENNAKDTSQKLLHWANAQLTKEKLTSLSMLRCYSKDDLSQALLVLEQKLYSKQSEQWDGSHFWSIFNAQPPVLTARKLHKNTSPKLASLYAKYD
ncbi:BatD [hydrothermal vent metagenome]|uniref:BatD n=1 Tax=hydrothermal vent metagenome TaxID=652676 RepID=A0A3B1B0L3_9ZZZZ